MRYVKAIFVLTLVLFAGIPVSKAADVKCLTPNGGRQPAFFPDGKTLAYVLETAEGGQQLMILGLASGKPMRVGQIDGVEKPSVSPDGKWILYASGPIFARQVWIVNSSDPKPRRINTGPGLCSMQAWIDKGKKIFFTLSGEKGEKWLKTDPFKTPQTFEEIKALGSGKPVFSPSGKLIALVAADDKGTGTIRIVKSDGSRIRTISPAAQSSSQTIPARGCYDPAFSPDERYLVYVRSDIQPASDIFLMDLKTGSEIQLTTDRADNQSPVFSPDGKSIAFVAAREGQTHKIFIIKRP
jgi:TolB protein